MQEMSSLKSANYDIGAARIRHKPVASEMPGTTLGVIPLRAFESGGALHDTPGLHLDHRLIHMMIPSEVKAVLPRKPLSPYARVHRNATQCPLSLPPSPSLSLSLPLSPSPFSMSDVRRPKVERLRKG